MKNILFILLGLIAISGCKKKGCKDKEAINYSHDPKIVNDPSSCEYLNEITSNTVNIQPESLTLPTTWGKVPGALVDYYINITVEIQSDLIIEPGVIIEFGPNGSLLINSGFLHAIGEENNHITLRNASNEDWGGIQVNNNNPQYRELNLTYVDIINASGTDDLPGGLVLEDFCDLQLNNISISGSSNAGLYVFSLDSTLSGNYISDMTISNCERPLVSEQLSIIDLENQISMLNNTNDWLEFPTNFYDSFSNEFSNYQPYYFSYEGVVTVPILNAGPGAEFYIQGEKLKADQISCNGTLTDPIVFKGVNGNAWQGLSVQLPQSPSLNYVVIEDVVTLHPSQSPLYVFQDSGGLLTFTNCTIQVADEPCGIKFAIGVQDSQIDITGSTFIGCDSDVCN